MNDFAKSKYDEGERGNPYDVISNNCGTFADNVIKQDKTLKTPSIIDPRPVSIIGEYQSKFTPLSFDPEKGTEINYKDKTIRYDKKNKTTTTEQSWWQRLWNKN